MYQQKGMQCLQLNQVQVNNNNSNNNNGNLIVYDRSNTVLAPYMYELPNSVQGMYYFQYIFFYFQYFTNECTERLSTTYVTQPAGGRVWVGFF